MKIYKIIITIGFATLLGVAYIDYIHAANSTTKLMLNGAAINGGSYAFSPNGAKVVTKSATDMNLVYVWNKSTGKLEETLNNGQPVDKIIWGPDSKSLVVYSETPKGYSTGHNYPIITLWNLSQ